MFYLEKEHFNPYDTFECGQCFRWKMNDEGYLGVVGKALLMVREDHERFAVEVLIGEAPDEKLFRYFDGAQDYDAIKRHLSGKDQWLNFAVSSGGGIRLLNQEPFETLLTFILSSNNNIPKIKMAVQALCEKYGQVLGSYKGQIYYAFPTLDDLAKLSQEDFKLKGVGYRNKALYETVQKIYKEEIDLNAPFALDDFNAKAFLKSFYGVGDKVADCVLLFAYEKKNAFPVDTWVKKLLRTLYAVDDVQSEYERFAKTYFDLYGGYAQQYLFHYIRNLKGSEKG